MPVTGALAGLALGVALAVPIVLVVHDNDADATRRAATTAAGDPTHSMPAAAPAASATAIDFRSVDELMAAPVEAFPAQTKGKGAQPLAPRLLPDGTKEFSLTASSIP